MNKRNLPLIITGVAVVVVAAVIFIVAGVIAGWDFAGFFKSQTFIWICVLLGLYIVFVGTYLIIRKVREL